MATQLDPPSIVETSPQNTLAQWLDSYWYSISISVAAQLGIADLLTDGPRHWRDLATACRVHPGALYRLLRALASIGVFAETFEERFTLTPLAELLQTHHPRSMRSWAIMLGELWWHPFGELLYSVTTGQPAFDRVYGAGYFEYLAEHPKPAAYYNDTMTQTSGRAGAVLMAAVDLAQARRIVDVGGGHGALLVALLKAHPRTRGTLLDLPTVVDGAAGVLQTEGVRERCDLVGGDFFTGVPAGGDVYVLRYVLHDWDDARAGVILTNCRRAMGPSARLFVIEQLVQSGNTPAANKFNDLRMLVLMTGRERTEAEYRALLTTAGFATTRVIPTPGPSSIIEATPA